STPDRALGSPGEVSLTRRSPAVEDKQTTRVWLVVMVVVLGSWAVIATAVVGVVLLKPRLFGGGGAVTVPKPVSVTTPKRTAEEIKGDWLKRRVPGENPV